MSDESGHFQNRGGGIEIAEENVHFFSNAKPFRQFSSELIYSSSRPEKNKKLGC